MHVPVRKTAALGVAGGVALMWISVIQPSELSRSAPGIASEASAPQLASEALTERSPSSLQPAPAARTPLEVSEHAPAPSGPRPSAGAVAAAGVASQPTQLVGPLPPNALRAPSYMQPPTAAFQGGQVPGMENAPENVPENGQQGDAYDSEQGGPTALDQDEQRDHEAMEKESVDARRASAAQARFEHEEHNPSWTAETTAYLDDAVSANQLKIAAQSIECRTTLCRVELHAADQQDAQRLLELARPQDADLLIDQLPTVHNDMVAVVYMSRPEYPF